MLGTRSRRRAAEEARAADEALLVRRLRRLGIDDFHGIRVHENRTVLVSVTAHGVLRIHRGYAYASDRILEAIRTFVGRRSHPSERSRAEEVLLAFPVQEFVRSRPRRRRPERRRPGDRNVLARLRRLHRRLNRRHFASKLWEDVPIRISSRMRTRLAELTVDSRAGRPAEIAISRYHIEGDGWEEVEHTLLHEMVHQWQVEAGLEADHGETFRRKAREVGVLATAEREIGGQRDCIRHE